MSPHRVVIGVTDGPESWPFLLNSLGNLLNAFPGEGVTVEVVAYGPKSIGLLRQGNNAATRLGELSGGGIRFLACANTLKNQNIPPEDLLPFVEVIPAGIAYVIRRQEEGWAYIKGGF